MGTLNCLSIQNDSDSPWKNFMLMEEKKSSKSILNPIRTIVNQFRKKETDEMKLSKVGRSVEDL